MMYSVAFPSSVHEQAFNHLIRPDGQEDLCFALWHPSRGNQRLTALIHTLLPPNDGEREVHGNASFSPAYFGRALRAALASHAGLAFMHSHPAPGWQGMSDDDIVAEQSHAAAVLVATDLPFLGLTIGTDNAWSARFWEKVAPRTYKRRWCESVRIVGHQLAITLHPDLASAPQFTPELTRTVSAWGKEVQSVLANLTVGVIGAGSVGNIVGEALSRMGVGHILLLDFDSVEIVNLDRLLFATHRDTRLHRPKVQVLAEALRSSHTAHNFTVTDLELSIGEEEGFRAALDCDVLFSCVDRPWPRSVLNFIAYAHLIPVVDGGIYVEAKQRTHQLRNADWRAHVAMPTRRCLECLKQYDPGMVSVERAGYFDDPVYIAGLPEDHPIKRNENVFGFSLSVASLEILQLLSIIVAPAGLANHGAQRYRFKRGTLEREANDGCNPGCLYPGLIAQGDHANLIVTGKHLAAENARAFRQQLHKNLRFRLYSWFSGLSKRASTFR